MDESLQSKTTKVKLDYPFEGRPQPGQAFEVAEGVKWISMPLPFSLKWINLWLLDDGDGVAIVDCGIANNESRDVWEQIFENVLEGRPVTRVFCTHMHPDHVGLAGWLCKRFDCELWMSRLEYVTCRMLVGDTGRPAPAEAIRFYRQAGWTEESLSSYQKRFGTFGRAVADLPSSFRRLTHNDNVMIGGREWQIIEGSGHSPEHSCLYCQDLNVLISGDQLLPRISSNVSVHPTEPEADPLMNWMDSCHRLIEAVPEDVLVLPSHNEPFHGAHERLAALIDGHQRVLERLEAHLETPRKVTECFTALFGRKIGPDSLNAATGEAMAHLNYLRLRGRVHRTDQDGVHVYQVAQGVKCRELALVPRHGTE